MLRTFTPMAPLMITPTTTRTITTASINIRIFTMTELRTPTITITTATTTITIIRMPRKAGSGQFGRVRSFRLPLDLNIWFEHRINGAADAGASEVLLRLVHGGLRLRPDYMIAHRNALVRLIQAGDREGYVRYSKALRDTFEDAYLHHLEEWIKAEGPEA